MIFVTVGSMLPFDRLIRVTDEWAAQNPATGIFAQIGEGSYVPQHMPWARMLERSDFARRVRQAPFVVSHAGIGTIFTALELGVPIVVLPRRVEWREHTTDHQVHTAKWLGEKPGISVTMTDADLIRTLNDPPRRGAAGAAFAPFAAPEFVAKVREFVMAD